MKVAVPPVTEETPAFRDIYISDVSVNGAGRAMFFNGLPEMPIRNIDIKNVDITNAKSGIVISQAENVTIENTNVEAESDTLKVRFSKNVKVNGEEFHN